MCEPEFIQRNRLDDRAFTRSRKLSFPILIRFLLNHRKGSLQTELDHFFGDLNGNDTPLRHVTKSACSQARKHLSYTAFTALNQAFVNTLYASRSRALKTWKGFRLCAIDGSQLRLPKESALQAYFGCHSGVANQATQTMGLCSVYYDVLNDIALDACLEPTTASERDCLAYHLEVAAERDLLLIDRGYNAFWVMNTLCQRQQAFCLRARTGRDSAAKQFVESGASEAMVTYAPSPSSRAHCEQFDLPTEPITLRLIRVDLPNEVEVLITNLDNSKRYPASLFKRLYHLRWGVETYFRRAKYQQEVEAISGKSVEVVLQDFHATVLASNLTAALALAGRKKLREDKGDTGSNEKGDYLINFAQAFAKVKQYGVALWSMTGKALDQYLKELVQLLALSYEPVRPGRSAPRHLTKFNKRLHHMAYKCTL
ncbi:MAG: IS4 family transposase [Verrucomicrobiota bacterium]